MAVENVIKYHMIISANMRTCAGSMLGQRHKLWANIHLACSTLTLCVVLMLGRRLRRRSNMYTT